MTEDLSEDQKDEEIVYLIQSGEIEFFSVLIERYENKLSRYGRKFLSDKEDINDVLQEVFIKTYKNIQSFDIKKKFSSWIYRIAHNEFINEIRKKRKKALPLFDLDVFLPHSLHNNELDQDIERQDIQKMIDKCLDELEPKYKEPTILYYLGELSYKEISDVMKIPVSTVGIRIKRAKEKMKNIYIKLGYNL